MTLKEKKIPLKRLEKMGWLLDNSIKIPGINYRIGVDGIIGLIPGIGDAIGSLLSLYILAEGARARMPRPILFRMAWNIVVDAVIGAIPIVGDVFDVAWKANARNVRLIKAYRHTSRRTVAQSRWLISAIAVALFLAIFVAGLLSYLIVGQVWSLIFH